MYHRSPFWRRRCSCSSCPLSFTPGNPKPIAHTGPEENPTVMLVLEAPGQSEYHRGIAACGPTGQELDAYLSAPARWYRMHRDCCYVTNVVKCRPPENRDPGPREIECCSGALLEEVRRVDPVLIASVGAVSSRIFLPGMSDLDAVNGNLYRVVFDGIHRLVVPTFHPAFGLHDKDTMYRIRSGFDRLATHAMALHAGKVDLESIPVWGEFKPFGHYSLVTNREDLQLGEIVSIDTETRSDGSPYCLSITSHPGEAAVVMNDTDSADALTFIAEHVSSHKVITLLHNAPFDLPVLSCMNGGGGGGIEPARYRDTMVMAYLLQNEPQGLKPLALRHLHLMMSDYQDVVSPAHTIVALAYLDRVLSASWENPKPRLVLEKGKYRQKTPWHIHRKVNKILDDWYKDPSTNVAARWRKIDIDDGRAMVEDALGPLLDGDLSLINTDDAVFYSGQDADATLQVYAALWPRILSAGLRDVFDVDMQVIPMICDMQKFGIPVDLDRFAALSDEYDSDLWELRDKISTWSASGSVINPASADQVSKLISDLGISMPTNKEGKESTNLMALKSIKKQDVSGAIAAVMEYREKHKLKTSYIDLLPNRVSKGTNRIHASFRITRVITGRLSCHDPNLMAMPIRTEEGRRIRSCFVASPGCSIVTGDYSQIEMKIAAMCADDQLMISRMNSGSDIHSLTAMDMFKIKDISLVHDMKHRYPAKRVGFGVLTQITKHGLAAEMISAGALNDGVPWTEDACQELIDMWYSTYTGIRDFTRRLKIKSSIKGYTEDIWGRKWWLGQLYSALPWVEDEGKRKAVSGPIQMSAQGVIKRAMAMLVPVYKRYLRQGFVMYPLVQIHDDLVWEVQDEILEEAVQDIKRCMEGVEPPSKGEYASLFRDGWQVPITVDFKTGKSWGEVKKTK